MDQHLCNKPIAESANRYFERQAYRFLRAWVRNHKDKTLLQFDRPLDEYLANHALHDFFLTTRQRVQKLLKNRSIARHLSRCIDAVYFDPISGDPL